MTDFKHSYKLKLAKIKSDRIQKLLNEKVTIRQHELNHIDITRDLKAQYHQSFFLFGVGLTVAFASFGLFDFLLLMVLQICSALLFQVLFNIEVKKNRNELLGAQNTLPAIDIQLTKLNYSPSWFNVDVEIAKGITQKRHIDIWN
jgi:hypothetical protein